ncbi:MAG: preprotein translocase subunit SecY [Anaerolineae bacterium]|nr:preprotein translocase subunit SecY [Anaerolineae bacterium]
MLQALRDALRLPDLRRRIFNTLLILVIFRIAAHVPVPGIDRVALQQLVGGVGGATQFINFLDLLSGGALANYSVLANGVYPYINATIIIQLLIPVIPALQRIQQEEGEAGQRKINQWAYYLAVPMAALQAWGQAQLFNSAAAQPILPRFGFSSPAYILPTLSVLVSMTAGTMFAIWLGELISEQGVGNGLSLIIFGGIVARTPANIQRIYIEAGGEVGSTLRSVLAVVLFLLITAATMFVIVYFQEGQRRIQVQYGKRVRGRRMYGGGSTYIPLRVNMAGMIPLIFASSILTLPALLAQFFVQSENVRVAEIATSMMNFFTPGGATEWYAIMIYAVIYFAAVVGFTFFYTFVLIEQQDLAGVLQRQGGFIPGIRPGKKTADYINGVYRRITLVGAVFLGGVAVLPYFTQLILETRVLIVQSTGLLIVVGVVVDTMRQLEAQLLMRHYEGFIK